MAVAATYTTEATNHKAADGTKNPSTATEGALFVSSTTVSVAAADDDTSAYFLLPLRSNWSVKRILLYCDAITGGTSFDLGLYTRATTPVVVDVDAYASAVDLSTAITKLPIDAAYEARNITSVNNKVWQDAGLSADSQTWYWLTLYANTVGSAQGDVTVIVEYTL